MSTPALVDRVARTVRIDHLFTVQEVAEILRCSVYTVNEKARSGEIKSLGGGRGGRHRIIPAQSLAEYLNNY